jgi:hypothetical protein
MDTLDAPKVLIVIADLGMDQVRLLSAKKGEKSVLSRELQIIGPVNVKDGLGINGLKALQKA